MPTHTKPILAQDDDIAHLRRSLQMPDLPYVDFSAQHERTQAFLSKVL